MCDPFPVFFRDRDTCDGSGKDVKDAGHYTRLTDIDDINTNYQ